jgi:hypothetical protein
MVKRDASPEQLATIKGEDKRKLDDSNDEKKADFDDEDVSRR